MDEPNHVWGVYVVQGAAITVKLRRAEGASYAIESAYLEANDGKTLPLHVASMLLNRRGLRGEPAVVALPDAAGFLGTVRVAAGRSAEALARELYDATPFDAGHAELKHALVSSSGGDEIRLVAAVKHSVVSAALHELEHKKPRPALAFGGAATVRGARALGLAPDPCVLVEVEPHTTVAYFLEHAHVRRFVIPFGEREIVKDKARLETLVNELRQAADERPASVPDAAAPPRQVPFVLVGPGSASRDVRTLLAAKFGERLVGGVVAPARVRAADDGRVHHAPLPALAGAVGAALEATTPPDERLLFRDVPDDFHAHREHPARPWAAAVALTLAAFGVYEIWARSRPPETPADRPKPPAAAPADGDRTADEAAPPSTAPAPAPALRVEPIAPGKARVSWSAGAESRVLRRFGGAWTDVAKIGAAAGSVDDEVPGATQSYGWRIDDGDAVFAKVVVPVQVDFVGPGKSGGARFVLTRSWRGTEYKTSVDVAPGEPVRTTSRVGAPPTDVTFDAACSLVGVRTRTDVERTPERVPTFRDDGRIDRAADGGPVLVDRIVSRPVAVIEAECATGEGPPKKWTRRASGG
jgi:hypothetical protein